MIIRNVFKAILSRNEVAEMRCVFYFLYIHEIKKHLTKYIIRIIQLSRCLTIFTKYIYGQNLNPQLKQAELKSHRSKNMNYFQVFFQDDNSS